MAESVERGPVEARASKAEAPSLVDDVRRHEALETRPKVRAELDYRRMMNDRPAMVAQRKTAERLAGRAAPDPRPVQPPPANRTGLPDRLKDGVEALSGVSLDGVKVHYNSSKPAQLQALAFAQGSDIHVAPGQEAHLPHEAWHVVQQVQGRVRPTVQLKEGVGINDDQALEREADSMGAKAAAEIIAGAEPTAAVQLHSEPVVQLGKDKKKRLQKPRNKNKKVRNKDRGKTGTVPSEKLEAEEEWQSGDDDVSYHVIAQEGGEKTPYEEEYETPQLFWRGDSRGPSEVFATGFTTKNEREGRVESGANRIIWREGGATDDILPASAVCMAKDIRGGAFFPLSGEDEYYLYAVGKTQAVNTFKAQKHAEQAATGESDFRQDSRYQYDPEYEDDKSASAVWQFQEYAAHRVESQELAAAFKVFRRTLVPPDFSAADPEDWPKVAIAGVQFRMEFAANGPIGEIQSKSLRAQMGALAKEARAVAAGYSDWYPDEKSFLSYMGIVKPKSPGNLPKTMDEAPSKVRQVQPVVVQEKPAADARRPSAIAVNDDPALEREADLMGAKALRARQDVEAAPAHSPTSSGSAPAQLARIAVGFDRVSAATNQDEDSLVTTGLANCIAVAAQDLNSGVAVMGHLNTATIIGNLAAFRAFAALLTNELGRAAGAAPNPRFHVSLGSLWMGRGHETQGWWDMRHALILDCISAFGTEPTQAGGTAEFDLAAGEIRGSGTLIDEDATVEPPDDDPHGQAGDAIPYDRLTRTNAAGHKLTKNMSMLDKLSVAISPD